MNSAEIFSLALGLESPWEIKSVEMKVTTNSIKELHLHIGYIRGFKFKDKTTGGQIWQVDVPWARKQSGFTLLRSYRNVFN